MLKRFLVSCSVVLGLAAAIACSGDSGDGDGNLTQKPKIVTDRDFISARLFEGQGQAQTLLVTNKGIEDLVVSGIALTGDPSLISGGNAAPFRLLQPNVIQLLPDGGSTLHVLPDGGVTSDPAGNTIKSNKSGFISMQFTGLQVPPGGAPDGGYTVDAGLTIQSNADNAPSKAVGLQIISVETP